MADMRATEVWYGRQVDPSTDYADSAAAPVKYVRYTYPAGTTPPPSEMPMVPPPVPPVTHIREPVHSYPPPPEVLQPYLYPPVETSAAAPMPPPPVKAPPPPEEFRGIPGVQYPDGHFEPHPAFVKKPVPVPAPVVVPEEPAKHVTEVAVPVCCEACRERIENYVGEADGVDDVQCDVTKQKVKVVSDIAPADVLQLCRKCFKKSQIIDAK